MPRFFPHLKCANNRRHRRPPGVCVAGLLFCAHLSTHTDTNSTPRKVAEKPMKNLDFLRSKDLEEPTPEIPAAERFTLPRAGVAVARSNTRITVIAAERTFQRIM